MLGDCESIVSAQMFFFCHSAEHTYLTLEFSRLDLVSAVSLPLVILGAINSAAIWFSPTSILSRDGSLGNEQSWHPPFPMMRKTPSP